MKFTTWKQALLYLAVLAAAYFLFSLAEGNNPLLSCSPPDSASPEQSAQTKPDSQPATSFNSGEIGVNDLPPEARTTLQLIKNGGPFPFSQDNTVFSNYEGLLPKKSSGYYREYTVITPGSRDRGARRIVAGANKEYYYTSDHYRSFKLIRE
jgi:ribonuclease T1